MTSIRRLLFLVTTLALMAFALPASAAKTITLTVPAGPLAAGVQTIQVSINNTGNSNANSFEIDWIPNANFSVQGGFVTAQPANVGTLKDPGVFGSPYKGIVFNKQAPNKSSVAITLNVTVTGSCGPTSTTWKAAAWTGSPGPLSTSFDLTGGPYSTSTAGGACTISYVTQPKDAFTGKTITSVPFDSAGTPVKVQLMIGAAPAAGVSVSASSVACSITGSATTDSSGIAAFATLTSTASASVSGCVLSASATGYSPNPANSNSFNIVKPDGTLGCNNTNNFAGTPAYDPNGNGPFVGTPGFALRRHFNLTGDCPFDIPYTATFDPANDAFSFIADKLGQSVIVEYALVLNPSATVNGWPPDRHPKFAWGPGLSTNPPSYPGDYIDGLACNNNFVDSTSRPNNPPVPPYSTSLFPQYTPAGSPAQMCVSQLGWTPVAAGMVQWWIKVTDSDGFTKMP